MGIELEQKYVVDSQRPWQVQAELLSLLNRAGYEVRLLGETPQEDVYYDTPEDDFLLTGGSLRVRRRGERRVLTLKTPVGQTPQTGAFARREEELELSSDALPADFLRERLPELDPDALRPAAQVENLRRTYEVKGPVGCRFELAFDDVIFRDAGTRGDRPGTAGGDRTAGGNGGGPGSFGAGDRRTGHGVAGRHGL